MYRNFGILIAFIVATLIFYLVVVETVDVDGAQADALVFLRGTNKEAASRQPIDEESGPVSSASEKKDASLPNESDGAGQDTQSNAPIPTSGLFKPKSKLARSEAKAFQWKNLSYDIVVDKENRRLLDDVFGWVKPGSLTALMVGEINSLTTRDQLTDVNHRALRELERRHFSMCLLTEYQPESSMETSQSTASLDPTISKAIPDTRSSRTFTCPPQPLEKLSDSVQS